MLVNFENNSTPQQFISTILFLSFAEYKAIIFASVAEIATMDCLRYNRATSVQMINPSTDTLYDIYVVQSESQYAIQIESFDTWL